jgi:cysteine synthase
MTRIYEDNSLSIGHTPIVKLNRIGKGYEIYAKIESRNPAGSVKMGSRGHLAITTLNEEGKVSRLLSPLFSKLVTMITKTFHRF